LFEANNRISTTGYSYDTMGNLTGDVGGHIYSYNAENLMVSYDNGVARYFYDGNNRRVKSTTNSGGTTTIFIYDVMGKLVAEYSNGVLPGGGTSYLTKDSLGSPRIITSSNQAVKARHDYLPFGEEVSVPYGGRTTGQGYIADNVRQKFTSKERDVETGLDYFGARYYSSPLGRFTSADSFAGDGINPQTLNLYTYTLNNPLALVDPTGHMPRASILVDYYDDYEIEADRDAEEIIVTGVYTGEDFEYPVPQGKNRIDQAKKEGKNVIIIYFAGVRNGKLAAANANANAKAIADWLGVEEYQVIPITNNNFAKALTGVGNPDSANAGVELINYARDRGNFKEDQIILVAHSNGVPTMDLMFSHPRYNEYKDYKHMVLIAPNTSDGGMLYYLIKFHSRRATVAMSDNDEVLTGGILGFPAHLSVAEIKKRAPDGTNVISTGQEPHFLTEYIKQLQSMCGKCGILP
ncbi:MAG: RHS repeat-associated core domain-containing protein, partial [Acidobacteriota bacterium]